MLKPSFQCRLLISILSLSNLYPTSAALPRSKPVPSNAALVSLEAGTVQVPVNTPSAVALEASTAALETSIATLEASTAALEADPPVTSAREPREVPDITL